MLGYREELYIRLRTMQAMIASGVKIKKKTICNTLGEASIAIHEVQNIEAKLDVLGKENYELRRQLENQQVINNEKSNS